MPKQKLSKKTHKLPLDSQIEPLRLLTVNQVAELFGFSTKVIYTLAENNQIPHYKIGRNLRFKPKELEAWLSSNELKEVPEFEEDDLHGDS